MVIPVAIRSHCVSTLPFWKVAKTRSRSTKIQKITNVTKDILRGKKSRCTNVQTMQKLKKAILRGFPGNPQAGSTTNLICPCSLISCRDEVLGGKKEIFPPLSTDYIYLCKAARPTTAQRSAYLSRTCFFLILARKGTRFTNERALHQADRASLWKFKVSMLNRCSNRKPPKPKCYTF